jgi:hypothetical protein
MAGRPIIEQIFYIVKYILILGNVKGFLSLQEAQASAQGLTLPGKNPTCESRFSAPGKHRLADRHGHPPLISSRYSSNHLVDPTLPYIPSSPFLAASLLSLTSSPNPPSSGSGRSSAKGN